MKEKIRSLFYKKVFTWDFAPDERETLRPWVLFTIGFVITFTLSRLGII